MPKRRLAQQRRLAQPEPREHPELDVTEEDVGPPTPRRRRRAEEREPGHEAPDMGIGLDERGEIDRRFEP